MVAKKKGTQRQTDSAKKRTAGNRKKNMKKEASRRESVSSKERFVALFKLFIANFEIRKDFFVLCLYDIAYYLIMYGVLTWFRDVLLVKYAKMQQMLNLASGSIEQLQAVGSSAKALVYSSVGIISGFVLLMFLAYVIFKCFIWTKIYRKRFSGKLLLKFAGVNALIVLVAVVLTFISAALTTAQDSFTFMLVLFVAPVAIYITNILQPVSISHDRFKSGLKFAAKVIFTKPHWYLVPYFLLGLVYLVIFRVLNMLTFLQGMLSTIVYLIFIVAYFTFAKLYLARILRLFESED